MTLKLDKKKQKLPEEVRKFIFVTPLEEIVSLKLKESFPPKTFQKSNIKITNHISDILTLSLLKYFKSAGVSDTEIQTQLNISNKELVGLLKVLED
mgnify:CR=1 FL=1